MSNKKIVLTKKELLNDNGSFVDGGVEICIPGFKGDPFGNEGDGQIWLEIYEGKFYIHIWNGKIDPTTVTIDPE